MKTKLLFLTVFLAAAAGLSAPLLQPKRNRATKEFMREKLELSHRLIEGLATENFDLIASKGAKLSAISSEPGWRVFEHPNYNQQSAIFRQHVDALVKAAKSKDLDAATLAYVRVTMSCVDCHKLIRGKLVVSPDGVQASLPGRGGRPFLQ